MARHGTSPAAGARDHYYGGVYWNVFDEGIRQINKRASGDPNRSFLDQFQSVTENRTFNRALVLNCGNGWFERELFKRGLLNQSIGIDWSQDLLDEAQRDANTSGYAAEYVRADINEYEPTEPVDLIVNYAAGHHIRYLDRVLRRCCLALDAGGYFLSWDYVGPHRNQYPWDIWEAAWQLNQRLPPHRRGPMNYPHLPTLLADDPTEAIHSELYEAVFTRYFQPVEQRPIGGALAYLVLADNEALLDAPPREQDELVRAIFEADARFLAAHLQHNFFTFAIARPNKEALADASKLAKWTTLEEEREAAADRNDGAYYPTSSLQAAMEAWVDDRVAAQHRLQSIHLLQGENEMLQRQLATLAQRFPNPQLAAIARSRLVRWVRGDRRR